MKWILLEKEYIVVVTPKEYGSILEKMSDINWIDTKNRKVYINTTNRKNFVLTIPWNEKMNYKQKKKIALYSIKTIQMVLYTIKGGNTSVFCGPCATQI